MTALPNSKQVQPVTIKHLLALFIIISNTLINSVWASVHLISNEHSANETPHLHVISDLKSFLNFGQNQDIGDDSSIDGNNHDESEESHFHVLSDLITQPSGIDRLKANLSISTNTIRYRTLIHSPPTPPPATQP